MSIHDLNNFYEEAMGKLYADRERLKEELAEKEKELTNSVGVLRDSLKVRSACLSELHDNKLINNKLKKDIEIKKKFLDGVHKIKIPLFNKEIDEDFRSIQSSLIAINEITSKLNFANQFLEKEKAKIIIQPLLV